MGEMRDKGMFIVLPYELLRDSPQLRISPLGCAPQRERRPRMINDYTFSGINPQTVKRAPPEAMQWEKALHRLLWYVFHGRSVSWTSPTVQNGSLQWLLSIASHS